METLALEDRVHAELLEIRKSIGGVSVELLARCRTISGLLGGGDPRLAYSRLMHELLDADWDVAMRAAAASLGFASDGVTHLNRLDDFGASVHLDQRQVRRYSDKGLRTLARLISTNWPTETAPQLGVVVIDGDSVFEIHLRGRHLELIEMKKPTIRLWDGSSRGRGFRFRWVKSHDDLEVRLVTQVPVLVPMSSKEALLEVIWRGELWPKFTIVWMNPKYMVRSETLGNKLRLDLGSSRDEANDGQRG